MEKTIAAIATPLGRGGISVIRISGKNAIEIADSVFRGSVKLCEADSHTIHYGFIHDGDTDIDQVLVSVMRAPKTYTGEDVAEINCHGGIVITNRVLACVIKAGSTAAEPGEFTKRAFLNGKIDLSQAEAVIDIINAENTIEQSNAFGQLKGKLSEGISAVRTSIISLAARMQVAIDYPDEDLEDVTPDEIISTLTKCKKTVDDLINTSDNGKIVTDGICAAIVGKPNVGKSSLLNYLAGSDRAIVTDIAGTTRDVLEERVNLDGVPLRLIDTAGIRQTEDAVEKIGVEKSKREIDEADVLLVMLDASTGLSEDDKDILGQTTGKNRIILINKTDMGIMDKIIFTDEPVIELSVKNGTGIDELSKVIKEKYKIGEIVSSSGSIVTNIRQKTALLNADEALARAISVMQSGQPQDLAALDIYQAADSLGEITGQTVSEDIVTNIFHNFCVGK